MKNKTKNFSGEYQGNLQEVTKLETSGRKQG